MVVLVFTILRLMASLLLPPFDTLSVIFGPDEPESIRSLPGILGLTYVLGMVGLIPYSIYVLTTLLRKKPCAPRRVIVLLTWAFALSVIGAYLSKTPGFAIMSGFSAAFWGTYFTSSKRVAITYGRVVQAEDQH